MVEKNRKQLNTQRARQGKGQISAVKPNFDIFHGRNMFISFLFLSVSLTFIMFFSQTSQTDTLFWVTVICYFLLALYFFFVKRPYIKVEKSEIAIRRLGREKITPASEIEKIKIQPGYVIITFKGKRSSIIFSRFFNRYDIKKMAPKLKEFSDKHAIPYELEIS